MCEYGWKVIDGDYVWENEEPGYTPLHVCTMNTNIDERIRGEMVALIAASPKLLSSLIEMVNMFQRKIDGEEGPDDAAAIYDRARDAITLAMKPVFN